ncbi:hypothetical protein AAFC00_001611 [Neodothiora populina]|uniref:AA9 family lytic polysaccharide monooxygenase n=1 Tax=Neodothiora populina TaxID=2781224 RepID=A0ABR3PPH0_9PEZI
MKNAALIALIASAKLAFAHTTIYAGWINDVDQGLGNTAAGYIRSPPNNNPVKDVTSSDMTCNVNNVATAKTLSVAAGDKFTFEWHHDSRSESDDIIASSHKGPVMVYIAPTDTGSSGSGWVKIAEDGYDASTKQWAVDTLIANKGKHSITIPDITAGNYLLRAEIIALHEGGTLGGAQLYMECVQVKITSSGATSLPAGVSIPGAYKATDAGIHFDIYNGFTSYPIPGPPVWSGASSSAVNTQAAVVSSSAVAATSSAPAPATSSAAPVSSAAPTTLATLVKTSTSAASATPTATTVSGSVALYGQCGGSGYTGATTCVTGSTCKEQNPYYSQCVSSS